MPLAELQLAIRMLQDREAPWLDGWRRRVMPRLPQHARMVLSLVPAVGWAPTFLGPAKADTRSRTPKKTTLLPPTRKS